MRNIVLLFVLFFIAGIPTYSQFTIKPGVGLNFTDFSKDGTGEVKAKTGFQVGGSIVFGNRFFFEPGIFYVGKSTQFTTSGGPSPEFKADIKGIRVPIAAGLTLVGDENTLLALRAFGGASGFFVTSVGDDIDKDELEKANFGVFAGAGLNVWKLYLDLSYEWSMTNVQKDVSLIDFGKSRSLFITAGFRINL